MITQRLQILNHLLSGGSLTPVTALSLFGCFRLAAVIKWHRSRGYPIKTMLVQHPNRPAATFAEYFIAFPDLEKSKTLLKEKL